MARIPLPRQVRVTITVWPKHCTFTLATRDRRDDFAWDKRIHTWDLPIHGESLEWETILGAVEAMLKAFPEQD